MSATSAPWRRALRKPHPFLKTTVLFSGVLPPGFTEADIQKVFEVLGTAEKPNVVIRRRFSESISFARLVFNSQAAAELALAVLGEGFISSTFPHLTIVLSTEPPDTAQTLQLPMCDAPPCIAKPVNGRDALPPVSSIFRLLRFYGPIKTIDMDSPLGCRIQFWNESDSGDAQRADIVVVNTRITLHTYDPKVIFCKCPKTTEAAIRSFFQDCGQITSVSVYAREDSFAVISFSAPDEAMNAIHFKNGCIMPGHDEPVSVCIRLQEPRRPVNVETVPQPQGFQYHYQDEEPEMATADGRHGSPDPPPSPTNTSETAVPHSPSSSADASRPDSAASPAESLSQQWDQTWRAEAQRLQKELTLVESAKLFIQEDRFRLEDALARSRSQNTTFEVEILKLRASQDDLQAQVDELLRQQEEWLLERGTAKDLQVLLTAALQANEDLERQLSVSESRRKLLELEKQEWLDFKRRGLGKERRAKEDERKREEERRQAEERQKEEERKKEEARLERERMLAKERERAEEERRHAAEAAKKAREEKERREREQAEKERKEREKKEEELRRKRWAEATQREERRCRARDRERWIPTFFESWTHKRAFDRFLVLLDEFSDAKFTEEKPLTTGAVPWPVLNNPYHEFDITALEWGAVGTFFKTVRPYSQSPKDFNALIQRVHLAFHPDRWAARKILKSVMDDNQRTALKQAGNVVSQAVTPLWRESKG